MIYSARTARKCVRLFENALFETGKVTILLTPKLSDKLVPVIVSEYSKITIKKSIVKSIYGPDYVKLEVTI